MVLRFLQFGQYALRHSVGEADEIVAGEIAIHDIDGYVGIAVGGTAATMANPGDGRPGARQIQIDIHAGVARYGSGSQRRFDRRANQIARLLAGETRYTDARDLYTQALDIKPDDTYPQSKIEQIDAPHVLYGRPKSRFVAGFIGRTNFVEGTGQGSDVRFDGFTAAASALEGAGSGGRLLYSLRPQAIGLSTQVGSGPNLSVEAEIVDRSYLGEYWDYQVRPLGGSKPLRVSTAPTAVFEVGSRVWLEIAPSAMVRVE